MNFIEKIIIRKSVNKMATTFNLGNWFVNNAPKSAQVIGDISLVSAVLISIPADLSQAGIPVPHWAVMLSSFGATLGVIIKALTKFTGTPTQPTKPQ